MWVDHMAVFGGNNFNGKHAPKRQSMPLDVR